MVWIDGVQLEEGPQATGFETRHPVEAHLSTDKPFSGTLHAHGEPFEIDLLTVR